MAAGAAAVVVGHLEGKVEANDEGVLDLTQHVALRLGVGNLLALDNVALAQHLHGIDAPIVLLAHHHDLAEAALAHHLEQRKVLQPYLLVQRHASRRHRAWTVSVMGRGWPRWRRGGPGRCRALRKVTKRRGEQRRRG